LFRDKLLSNPEFFDIDEWSFYPYFYPYFLSLFIPSLSYSKIGNF
jgi:hypothetical protein